MELKCIWCGSENVHVCNDTIEVGDFSEHAIHLWCEYCPGITAVQVISGKGNARIEIDKPNNGWSINRLLKPSSSKISGGKK